MDDDENYAQGSIVRIIGGDHRSFALVAGMSGQQLINLLRVVTTESAHESDKETLGHLAACMENARPWRDYFAHGLRGLMQPAGDGVIGFLATNGGRRAPDNRQDLFTLDEAQAAAVWMSDLERFTRQIRLALEWRVDQIRLPEAVRVDMPTALMPLPPQLRKTPLAQILHPFVAA